MAASMRPISVTEKTYQPATPDELIMTLPSQMDVQRQSTFQVDEKVFMSTERLNRARYQNYSTFAPEVDVGDAFQADSTSSDTTSIQSDRIVAILLRDESRDVLEAIKSQDFEDLLRSSRHLRTFADFVAANLVAIENGRLTLSPSIEEECPEPKPSVRQGRRAVEQAWIDEHPKLLREYAGQWVVVEGAELVAHGAELRPLIEAARARGITRPYVFFIDPTPPTVARIGL